MKYILEFENWVSAVKEGFDAKIEDDKDTKDEIEIEAPEEPASEQTPETNKNI